MCSAKCHVRVPLSIFFCILADAMQCDAPQYILYWICEMKCMLNMSFNAKFVFYMAYTVAVWWLWILITEQKKMVQMTKSISPPQIHMLRNNATALLFSFLQSFTFFRYSFLLHLSPRPPTRLLAPLCAFLTCTHQFVKTDTWLE